MLFLCQQGIEAKRTVASEGQSVRLHCILGLIKVIIANYGWTDRTTCTYRIPPASTSNRQCFQGKSLHTMSTW
ncbi:L-rhamnose-binding lectin CSL1 [Labeo rohita]|uniref:L-rhamnose-binding lectin CSL1 n=1 Tax=Labeo rohita TaxID=84645 RepID=A0ABQ8LIU6_LABRO|nr:L-rhamnose-binding lectin CSL1 [Labeo rohita]